MKQINKADLINIRLGFFSTIYGSMLKTSQLILAVIFLSLVLPTTANAHRGVIRGLDTCRILVGDEVIHFTAYTPSVSGGTGWCQTIPNVAVSDLVFDYEGRKLRNMTVEFEITKEPEGTRVYYHKPEKIKKGSVDAKVDFTKSGAGDYLAHITIMYNGEKQDSHLPFSVGLEDPDDGLPWFIMVLLVLVLVIIIAMVFMSRSKKNKASS